MSSVEVFSYASEEPKLSSSGALSSSPLLSLSPLASPSPLSLSQPDFRFVNTPPHSPALVAPRAQRTHSDKGHHDVTTSDEEARSILNLLEFEI